MDDSVDWNCVGNAVQRLPVGEIDTSEGEAVVRPALEVNKAGFLELRVVIIVEIVDPDHLVAAAEQCTRDCRTDESRSAGHKNSH
jgi:hypothetical protein